MRSFLRTAAPRAMSPSPALALLLALALLPRPAGAEAAPGGTVIRNVAETTYFNTGLGIVETVLSNPVEARVLRVPDLEVTGFSDLVLTRGALARYHFEIRNSGNVPLTTLMWMEDREGPIMRGSLIPDLNANGLVEEDERRNRTWRPLLEVGERLALIYEFRVPAAATEGSRMSSTLVVRAADQSTSFAPAVRSFATARTRQAAGLQGEAHGITRIMDAALQVEKLQAPRGAGETARLDYTLRVRNNSDAPVGAYGAIGDAPLRIDGAARSGVLVRDAIPLNAVFDEILDAGGMLPLYHRAGDPTHDYLSARPDGEAAIDAVAFFLDRGFPVGHATDPAFSVSLPAELGAVEIVNTAETWLDAGDSRIPVRSNTVRYDRGAEGPGRLGFEDPASGADLAVGLPGTDTRLRLVSGLCNLTGAADSARITVRSRQTGDAETLIATETGANTGVFLTAALPLARMDLPRAGDGVLATMPGDDLAATARCGDAVLDDTLPVSPGNYLFNAIDNAAIAGVRIALVDSASDKVLGTTRTDALGWFAFGPVAPGSYRYAVIGNGDWAYPSVRQDFPGFNRLTTAAAWGAAFRHAGGMVNASDIPVDPAYGAPLSLQKTAARDTVVQGGFLGYSLTFSNNMQQALQGTRITDTPPRGVTLVPGSVRLDGAPLADPGSDGAGGLVFELGRLAALSEHELSYVMQVTAAAREGRLDNTAVLSGRQAGTGTPHSSPRARASVRLDNSGGVFAREGTVIGSVFMDCDGDGLRGGLAEPGIPGVRLVTQEGLSVVTDIDGKYSLYGLRPVTHAFLLQPETLPRGTRAQVTRTNDLRRGGARLVPLRRGELRAEHFAVAACTPAALAEVEARRARFEAAAGPATLTAADLPIEGQRAPRRSARAESGIATTTQITPAMLEDGAGRPAPSRAAPRARAAAPRRPLEAMIATLDPAPGFVDFEDGESVARSTQNIRVKGKADLTLSLLLNGREVGADRVGERTVREEANLQALDYVAVKLRAGENRLTLVGRDGFGIERLRKEITLRAPGKPAGLQIILPETAPAAPTSVVPVVVRVLDAQGLPVPASGTVTLHARSAVWDVADIRPGTPGVQAYLDNGEATFGLVPPQVAGPDRITVSGAFGTAEAAITFTPDLDERILVGVIEGAVALGDGAGALLERDRLGAFEDTAAGLRGELYLKGAIRGDALLTLRYSSDRDTEDRLFRDIRGDEYYPVYGDNAERGQDAQSSGRLFVKVEKGRSYILYGDIAIAPESSALKLDGMRRVVTGGKAHWENDRVSVTVFSARTAQTQRVRELPGRGVSGPYDLDLGGYVQGSERVEILVRDGFGGDILSARPLRRGTDYVLDFFRDTITFDAPVRQADPDGNPVSIRVTYEVESGAAERYWLYGGEVNYALGERTSAGARAVHADAAPGNPARERLQSAYLRHEDTAGGTWEAEVARSEDAAGRAGGALRLSYERITESRRLSFEAIHTGERFLARGGLARPGTTQLRFGVTRQLGATGEVTLGAELLRDRVADLDRVKLEALYARQFHSRLRGEIGLEYRRAGDEAATALVLGAQWTPLTRPDTAVEARLRHALSGDVPTRLTLGLSREPRQGWRAYDEVEFELGEGVLGARSRLGFTFALNDRVSGRTELSRAAGEADTTFTQGLTARWQGDDANGFEIGIEHSRLMEAGEAALTSVAMGGKWATADGRWVGDGDLDTTFEKDGNTYYASLGLAGRISPDVTLLGRSRVALDDRRGAGHLRMRSRAGVALRPASDPRLEVLAWYEHRLDEKYDREAAHLWSVDAAWEVTGDLRLNGKYAGQSLQTDLADGGTARSLTQLVQGGVNLEFGRDRFQLGLTAAHLWDGDGNSAGALGAELGFVPVTGAQVAVGFNTAQARLPGQDALWQDGFYLRFHLLLDNSLWDQLDRFLGA